MKDQPGWMCVGGPIGGAFVKFDGMIELERRVTLAELGRGRLSFGNAGWYQASPLAAVRPEQPAQAILRWVPAAPSVRPRDPGGRTILFTGGDAAD